MVMQDSEATMKSYIESFLSFDLDKFVYTKSSVCDYAYLWQLTNLKAIFSMYTYVVFTIV